MFSGKLIKINLY